MTPLKARILLADDHALVRHGLRMVLEAQHDLELVAEAGDGAEAVSTALVEDVDLAILDIAMPRMTGLHAARELNRHRPELRILILSMYENEQYRSDDGADPSRPGGAVAGHTDRGRGQCRRRAIGGRREHPRRGHPLHPKL